jgi:hypothetical protein
MEQNNNPDKCGQISGESGHYLDKSGQIWTLSGQILN